MLRSFGNIIKQEKKVVAKFTKTKKKQKSPISYLVTSDQGKHIMQDANVSQILQYSEALVSIYTCKINHQYICIHFYLLKTKKVDL